MIRIKRASSGDVIFLKNGIVCSIDRTGEINIAKDGIWFGQISNDELDRLITMDVSNGCNL